jgi:GGDEF domain-containing protein
MAQVARFGGDEFAVLQDDIEDTANVETLAAKIGEKLAAGRLQVRAGLLLRRAGIGLGGD